MRLIPLSRSEFFYFLERVSKSEFDVNEKKIEKSFVLPSAAAVAALAAGSAPAVASAARHDDDDGSFLPSSEIKISICVSALVL